MYKYVKELVPSSLRDMFTTSEDIHSYPTRQRANLRLPQGRTAIIHKTFRFKATHIWNEMARKVDHNCFLPTFMYKLKNYISNM